MTGRRGRPPKHETDLARQRLIDAAIDLFAERGYAGTSVSAICEQADVGKPALYWHFESKEGLLETVLAVVGSANLERVQKRTAELAGQGDPLSNMIRVWREIMVERPETLRLPMLLALEKGPHNALALRAVRELRRRAIAAIVHDVRAVVGLDLPDLDLVARVAVTLLQGAIMERSITDDPREVDRFLDETRRTLSLLIWTRLPDPARRASVDLSDPVRAMRTTD